MDYRKLKKEELIRILEAREPRVELKSPRDVFAQTLKKYAYEPVEQFIVLCLNGSNRLIHEEVVSRGIVNKCLIHPREVFYPAIRKRAVSIIIAHNHPSGQLVPSGEDESVTTRLVQAGKILGIKVQDHLIVSPAGGYYSFIEHSPEYFD